jgi:hypothetical protein
MISALLMLRRLAAALRVALLVEIARRLGMGFMTARAELEAAKAAKKREATARA